VAIKIWTNGTGNWNLGAWSPSGNPGAADDVLFNVEDAGIYTVFANLATVSIASLTMAATNATLSFNQSGVNCTVSGEVTVTLGRILLQTAGARLTAGTFVLNGGILTQSNGSLDVTGAGNAFSMTAGAFTQVGGTITVTNGASFTNTGTNIVNGGLSAGMLTIGAATRLTLSNPTVVVGAGGIAHEGLLSGRGSITGTLSGGGVVRAQFGTLDLISAISAGTALQFQVAGNSGSILQFDGTVGAGNTFSYLGSLAGGIVYNNAAHGFSGNIIGLNVGSSDTVPTNYFQFAQYAVTIVGSRLHTGTSGTVNLSDGSVLTLSGVTNTAGSWFVDTRSNGAAGTDIFLNNVVCFAAGTMILTDNGERLIEDLSPDDRVMTLQGGEPIRWIGRRRINLVVHPRPEGVQPVRISRHAFADGIPHRDLLVSPDHAILVDGLLICARQLINGATIRQVEGLPSIEYFHLELDAHAIVLAEGLTAESYLDTGNRAFFANSDNPMVLHPDPIGNAVGRTRVAGSCVPFACDEVRVRPIQQRLAERSVVLGFRAEQMATTTNPELRVVIGGRKMKVIPDGDGRVAVVLPTGTSEVRIASHAARPTDARPWLDDGRRLGVRLARIAIRHRAEFHIIPLDDPGLSEGWWVMERDGATTRRWTDGDALLRLPTLSSPAMLELRLSGTMVYPVRSVSAPVRMAV
jgi:hypothetical protein